MQKKYSDMEKFLYTTPKEEASFLSGAFQTVSYGAASVVVGPLVGLLAFWATHEIFAKPYLRDEKKVRHAHLKGFATGLALSMAVGMVTDSYTGAQGVNDPVNDELEYSELVESTQPQHSQYAPAHI